MHIESAHGSFYTDNVSARAHAAKSLEIRTEILDTCFPMAMIAYCTRNSRGFYLFQQGFRLVEAWGVEDYEAVALLRQALDGLYKHFGNTHEEAMVSVISFMVW